MKYYIILQPSIRSMGGEEMYTRNIVVSAKQNGYVPVVFHGGNGDKVIISDLKQFDKYEFPQLRFEPCAISERWKNKMIKRIHSILKNVDEDSIIESHELIVAEWGEILAKDFGCQHLAYMLLEHNTITYKPLYDFFRFKYERRELVGIVKDTIPDMFAEFDKNVSGYYLPAYCSNTYEEIPCQKEFKVGKSDYTIGSIGRTDKQFVPFMVTEIQKFIRRHQDKSFNILYVGGSMSKQSEELVKKELSSISNAKLYFTGMQFPLSVEMLRQMDVCIATAGSCSVSNNCGIPTICVDGNDSKAIGILGKTTAHTLFRGANEPPIAIDSLLDDVLIKGKYRKEDRLVKVNVDFTSHWDFVKKMSSKKEYYDIDKIQYSLKEKAKSIFLGCWYGLKPDSMLNKLISKIVKRLY